MVTVLLSLYQGSLAQVVTLLACIQEVSGLNLSWDTILTEALLGFSQFL
jgi:hypothetical protein